MEAALPEVGEPVAPGARRPAPFDPSTGCRRDAAGALGGFGAAPAAAQDAVRIGLPTKTYYPTIIAETPLHQKLFEKEGIKAELTIYRSGGETFGRSAAQLGGGSQEGRRGQIV